MFSIYTSIEQLVTKFRIKLMPIAGKTAALIDVLQSRDLINNTHSGVRGSGHIKKLL